MSIRRFIERNYQVIIVNDKTDEEFNCIMSFSENH